MLPKRNTNTRGGGADPKRTIIKTYVIKRQTNDEMIMGNRMGRRKTQNPERR